MIPPPLRASRLRVAFHRVGSSRRLSKREQKLSRIIRAVVTPQRPGQCGSSIAAAEVLVPDWRITGNAVPNPCPSSESLQEQREMIASVQWRFFRAPLSGGALFFLPRRCEGVHFAPTAGISKRASALITLSGSKRLVRHPIFRTGIFFAATKNK